MRFGLVVGLCHRTMRAQLITLLAVLVTAASVTTLSAQQAQLRAAAGIRAGFPSGISVKGFITENIAVEVTGGVRSFEGYNTRNIGGGLFFYMNDHGMNGAFGRSLSLYAGAGLGRSYYTYEQSFIDNIREQTGTNEDGQLITRKASFDDFSTNFKAYLGAQYLFPNAPIELTLDVGPNIHTGKVDNPIGVHGALGARYVLFRQKGAVR